MSMTAAEKHRWMTETPIPRLVTSLAIPTTVSQLITIIYNTADTYFVSHISTSASGAVGVAFALQAVIQALGFGVSMGCSSIVSRKLGAKDVEGAQMYASSSIAAAIAMGFLLLVSGLSTLRPLMRLFGATETMLPYACDYARIILIGAPVMCTSFILSAILKSEGEARLSMVGLTTGGLVNIALDPLFIFVFKMGIAGAALATILSQGVSLVILALMFRGDRSIIKLNFKNVSKKFSVYFDLVRIGFPTICRQGLASVSSALLNHGAAAWGGNYADATVAAVTISNKIYMLVRSVTIGLGQGFQPVAGYNYGAGLNKRVKKAFWFATAVGTALCLLCAVGIGLNTGAVIRWFRDDDKVVEIGSLALRFACMVMPLLAYSTFVNQLYQCLGFSVCATILASCRQGIFFVPIILLAPRFIGLTGVQLAQSAADLATCIVSVPFQIAFFKLILNKKNRKAETKELLDRLFSKGHDDA